VTAISGLDVEALSLWRGERMLFRDLQFSVRAGEMLLLEGANGSGKTSLLRAIAGFLEPRAGTIRIRMNSGEPLASGEERGSLIGWLGHQDGAKSQLTPIEALDFFAHYYGGGGAVKEALARVGLARLKDLPIQYLSAGQKRRLALARLSLTARPLWLLDEPLASLDAAGKALVADLVAQHCKSGGVAVVATHEPLGLESTARLTLETPA
jgi:heme exporter protein A